MSKKPPVQMSNLRRVQLPFQYTDEGRKQIAEKQKLFPRLPDFATKVPVTQGRVYASAFTFNLYSADTALDSAGNPCRPDAETAQKKDGRRFVQQHASYLQPLIENIDTVVSKFRDKMRTVDYDTLIGTGLSGALAVPTLARAVGCSWAIVRKDGDGSHSGNAVEGTVGRRWVFVDDLISTGQTRLRVRESMAQFSVDNRFDTDYVGDYLYYGNQFRPKEEGNT